MSLTSVSRALRLPLTGLVFALCAVGCNKGSEAAPGDAKGGKAATSAAGSAAGAAAGAPAGAHPGLLDPSQAKEQAPEQFTIKFETTQGDILVDVTRAWSPNGADRIFNLVKVGYYTDVAFFRVIDGFMAQVGISGDPKVNSAWRPVTIPDDPVKESNKRGYVTFAKTGAPNSRTTQFFINFADNAMLDGMQFAPFGKVRDMAVVDKLHKGYGEGAPRGRGPDQGRIQSIGNSYLRADFPNLDYIKSASIVPN